MLMRWFVCFIVISFSCFWFSESVYADNDLEDSSLVFSKAIDKKVQVGRSVWLYEDLSAGLGISEIVTLDRNGGFYASEQNDISIGTTSSAWWVKLELENQTHQAQALFLEQAYSLIDYVELWEKDGSGAYQVRYSGDMYPFSQRELKINSLGFKIELPAGSTQTYYLRFLTNGALSIDLSLNTPSNMIEEKAQAQLLQGLFYGALIAMLLYNLFIFIIVRDYSYLLYILYLFTLGAFLSSFNGLSAQYLWPEHPWWSNHSLLFFWGAVIVASLSFSKHFLNIKQHSRVLSHMANGFIVLAAVCGLGALVLPYGLVIKVLMLLAPPAYLLILIAGYQGIKRGYEPAIYFLTAWATLMLAAIVSTLISAGIISRFAALSPYIIQLGALIEVVLISIALASRIRSLEHDAQTDALTKLFNRRFFDHQIESSLNLARKQNRRCSLMLIDIDHFKLYNDTYGHKKGDLVLREVADNLQRVVRRTDYVCRYGGEEFAVILPSTSLDTAKEIAERVRETSSRLSVDGDSITVSVGLASAEGRLIKDQAELFKWADLSLYEAKENGRNRVCVHQVATEA